MWANAQRDGRPAEYRWCPLFNAVGWCPDGDFCVIFASCIFSEPRAAGFRHAF